MALASAGCEMPSSSYTAGPRPQLPGLWAAELGEIFKDQQEITTLTVIWARQLVSPQPKLGPVP